jgi:hypothetical protein
MLANFLSKSKPINFIVLLGFFLFFYVIAIYNNFFADDFHLNELLKSGLIFSLFLSIFFFYNFIVSKNYLTLDNSYAFFLFSLFLSFFVSIIIEYNVLILLLFQMMQIVT